MTSGNTRPTTTAEAAATRPGGVSQATVFCALGGLLLLTVVGGLAIGARTLSPADVWASLAGHGTPAVDVVVLDQRLPRTTIAVVVGAALAVAGSLMQALTRNPLADPGLMGVNAGAALAVVVTATLFGVTDLGGYVWASLFGAGVAAVGVVALGGAGGASSPMRLTLAGVAVSAGLTAVTQSVVLADPDLFDEFRLWVSGSVQNRYLEHLLPVLPFIGLGAVGAAVCAPGLDTLALGESVGRSLGVPVTGVRLVALGSITFLAGSATAVAGPLVFAGLAAPFVARRLVGTDLRRSLLPSALLGAVLVTAADVVARVLVSAEAPVGAVVTFVGAPLFVALVRSRRVPTL